MKTCLGRLRYATKQEAGAAGLRCPRQPLTRRQCTRCGGWHLSSRRSRR